ncbi:type I-B CRISPR-associated protein Cas7/Cst2/DevR [Anaerovorax odorimutans]|uniref:Type I-B CRISPR-associated protein Cas7/Cst2/DevR n=1 Tax=Anaerovorax odorimutans TaxID=109327 RepID=A0ABT1RLP4_9FIRM|nr:type I-B CRISPR-associated protein Cas7/Cst2/DevR [Anaerovorax odorimutans]MCQ4636092.1 type I-B CRISPR-associated protein Cas7/Cst2/DevR [Anaerovorax odorimutans]
MKKALTLTVVANMTSNYSEGLGNISSVQKVFKGQHVYAMRSRESLKNAICVQAGLYDDLETSVDGAAQKFVSEKNNAATCRALEGGYMSTEGLTYIRNSSFYLTDAVACDTFVNETRFHNNLYLASNNAKANGLNLQEEGNAKKAGLMPYQYEYDKSMKTYSLTIDLEMIGKDENFNAEADSEEKAERVLNLLNAVKNLSLVVKGNLDNAEPLFIAGGLSDRKTHYFENVVRVKHGALSITEDLKDKLSEDFSCALLKGDNFTNEDQVVKELCPISMKQFFDKLTEQVKSYYGV